MRGVAAGADLADGFRVAGAQAGIAADTAATPRRPQPRLGALGNQRPFELGDSAQHLQREHALRRGGVDRVAQAAEMRAVGLELLDDGEEMADRAGEAIEPDHDQGFAGRISCSRRASTGRLRSAPEACPRARWRTRPRAARRAADRCPVLRSRPAHSQSAAWQGGLRQFCRHEFR